MESQERYSFWADYSTIIPYSLFGGQLASGILGCPGGNPNWTSVCCPDCFKVNFDAAVFKVTNSAGIGIIIRNWKGEAFAAVYSDSSVKLSRWYGGVSMSSSYPICCWNWSSKSNFWRWFGYSYQHHLARECSVVLVWKHCWWFLQFRLCLFHVSDFPENTYFPEMLFSGKENIFKCLIAFQKMLWKIFSGVWLYCWKYHRKHIFSAAKQIYNFILNPETQINPEKKNS